MKLALSLVLGLSLVLLAGCRTTNTVEPSNPVGQEQPVNVQNQRTDWTLSSKAKLVSVRQNTTAGGFLKVQVEVKNDTWTRQRFNWSIEWLDEARMVIDTPLTGWQQMSLAGGEIGVITGVAPSPKAVDFRLKLLEAK